MPNETTTNTGNQNYISDAPTLIIGLGGLGCYMTNTLYKELPQEQKQFVEAIIMDTDVHELKEDIYTELKNSNSIIQTSPNEIVKDCVERLDISESVEQWFPVDLLEGTLGFKQMPEGAAQIRGISRLAMLDTITSKRIEKLNNKLNALLLRPSDDLEEACRIVIINSTAGGTGSGSFLQLALYIREYLDRRGISNATVRSFIIMPEIFVQNGDYNSQSLIDNVRANGYGVFKEVDAAFSFRAGRDNNTIHKVSLEYVPNQSTPEVITAGTPPFNVVTVFDYIDAKGNNIGHKYNYIENALDSIRLHLFSPLIGRGGIGSQTDNLINHHIASANRSNYSSSGAASIEYPVEDMIEYNALRWATEGISAEWLEIDRQILEEVRRVEQLRNEGIPQEMPDPHKRFGELIREKCEVKNPTPFYRHLYNDAHLLDENGERTDIKHDLWLNAVGKHIQDIVDQAISEKSSLSLNIPALKDAEQVQSQVSNYEKALTLYKKELDKRVQNTGLAIAKEVIWSPYQRKTNVLPQQDIQLNTWLLAKSEPLHPLAIRYFLSEVLQSLTIKLRECENQLYKLEKAIDFYFDKGFDDPSTEEVESAVDMANKNSKGWNRLKGDLKRFAEDYESKSKTQKNNIESYARYTVKLDCYKNLLGYITDLTDTWRLWFNKLEDVVYNAKLRIQKLSTKHEDNINPTVVYVLASSDMKEALWEQEKAILGNREFPPEISEQIYISVYKEKGKQYIDQLPPDPLEKWVENMFKDQVVGWCRHELRAESNINLNVSEAIRKEVTIGKRLGLMATDIEPSYQLQNYINQLNRLAVPLVNLEYKDRGEDFNFLCMNPDVESSWTQNEITTIFGSTFVNSGFSPYKISKLAIKHGLLATDLKDVADANGVYRVAYEQRVKNSRKVPRASTSPHLDDNWDSPAFLPEMDDEAQALAINNIYKATLINQANSLSPDQKPVIFSLEYDMEDLWHWFPSKNSPVPIVGLNRKSAIANLYNLVDVFAVNYHLVESVVAKEADRLTNTRNLPEDSPIIQHSIALIKQIYKVESQAKIQTVGLDRQSKLLNCLFDTISETLNSRYATNTAQAKLQQILHKIEKDVQSINHDTSDAYVQLITALIQNYSMG